MVDVRFFTTNGPMVLPTTTFVKALVRWAITLMHAAFVAAEIRGFMPEPARVWEGWMDAWVYPE